MKVRVYQTLLLAMIGLPLIINKIPLSLLEWVKGYFNGYLGKLLGVGKNMSDVSLYSDQILCPLPIHGLITEFKKHKVSKLLELQLSQDQLVRDNVPEFHTGKWWKVAVEATNIDSRIKMSKVMGNMHIDRTGLG